jgi:hypothetical protein
MNQSAIAMLQKTIELMNKDTCTELMPEMIPPLLTVNLFFFTVRIEFSLYSSSNTRKLFRIKMNLFLFIFSHGIVKHQVYEKQQFFVWFQFI